MAFTPNELKKIQQFKAGGQTPSPSIAQPISRFERFQRFQDSSNSKSVSLSRFDQLQKTTQARQGILETIPESGLQSRQLRTGDPVFGRALTRPTTGEPTTLGALRDVGRELFGEFPEKVSESLTERGEKIATGLAADQDPRSTFLQSFGQSLGGFSDVLGVTLGSVAETLSEGLIGEKATRKIKKGIGKLGKGLLQTKDPITGLTLGQAIGGISEEFKKLDPETQRNIEATGAILGTVAEITAAKPTKRVLETGIAAARTTQRAKRVGQVGEVIAEPRTAKTARLALAEGRIEPAKRGFVQKLFGGKEGEIIPTVKIQKASNIIQRDIPDLDINNPQKLFKQVKALGINKSKKLAPALKEVALPTDKVDEFVKIATDIEENVLNNPQIKNLLTGKEKKSVKEFLDNLLDAKNMDEFWQARIKYDKTVPSGVKQATELSDSVTQFRKDFWLETRGEMNRILDETTQGIGVSDEFAEMSALFEAQQNIIQRAPELLKPEAGLFTKENLIKAGIGGTGIAIGAKIFD